MQRPLVEPPAKMAYWLVPAEPQRSEFQRVVTRLAERFGGPNFVPHVTIYFGNFQPTDPIDEIVNSLSSFPVPVLRVKALLFTEQFTKSCFVQFEMSPELNEMCELVRGKVGVPEPYALNPHMSLFYGPLNAESRQSIQGEIKLPESVSFDSVTAIATPPRIASLEDVEYWREIKRSDISGSR